MPQCGSNPDQAFTVFLNHLNMTSLVLGPSLLCFLFFHHSSKFLESALELVSSFRGSKTPGRLVGSLPEAGFDTVFLERTFPKETEVLPLRQKDPCDWPCPCGSGDLSTVKHSHIACNMCEYSLLSVYLSLPLFQQPYSFSEETMRNSKLPHASALESPKAHSLYLTRIS